MRYDAAEAAKLRGMLVTMREEKDALKSRVAALEYREKHYWDPEVAAATMRYQTAETRVKELESLVNSDKYDGSALCQMYLGQAEALRKAEAALAESREQVRVLREALKQVAPFVYETSKVHARFNKECPCKTCGIAERVALVIATNPKKGESGPKEGEVGK